MKEEWLYRKEMPFVGLEEGIFRPKRRHLRGLEVPFVLPCHFYLAKKNEYSFGIALAF